MVGIVSSLYGSRCRNLGAQQLQEMAAAIKVWVVVMDMVEEVQFYNGSSWIDATGVSLGLGMGVF